MSNTTNTKFELDMSYPSPQSMVIIPLSEIFKRVSNSMDNCIDADSLSEMFAKSPASNEMSWGDTNYSLVNLERVLDALNVLLTELPEYNSEFANNDTLKVLLENTLESLTTWKNNVPSFIYVNLEG